MDQFRGPVGSSAVAIVLAYLASCPQKRDSDVKRVECCTMLLADYRFTYGKAVNPSPHVSSIIKGLTDANTCDIVEMEPPFPVRAYHSMLRSLPISY